ncbi:hypothetical protein GY24_03435 [Microterricola pindariensis]|uniref:PH domain-containing protein n=1 Tax=Microterricola pindariensis TaxID=478010 RepID=A0ABX5B001_9MICO|nr:hypothetical protein GY24_03435 [Microterricola pindariensis]
MHRGNADDNVSAVGANTVVVRPREQVFTQSGLAVTALLLPVFAVLYWLTIPAGTWHIVALAKLIAIVVIARFVVIYHRANIAISPTGVRESGFTGLRREIRMEEIESVLLVSLYRGATVDTEEQLFVIGKDGSTLLRMRARYWAHEDILRVADAIEAPATVISSPQTLDEFRREHSRLLFWFERRPRRSRA